MLVVATWSLKFKCRDFKKFILTKTMNMEEERFQGEEGPRQHSQKQSNFVR